MIVGCCLVQRDTSGAAAPGGATSAALIEKALAAKTSNPEMGFMKDFKRIAEIELPGAEFDRIDREASRRDGFGT